MITWANEVWPYVNGKALMSGIKLTEMEGSDMMDVLHFLFEEDFVSSTEEQALSRSSIREMLYTQMYGVGYSFKMEPRSKRNQNQTASGPVMSSPTSVGYEDSLAGAKPFDPREMDVPGPSKAKFVDSSTVPFQPQSFDMLDEPLSK